MAPSKVIYWSSKLSLSLSLSLSLTLHVMNVCASSTNMCKHEHTDEVQTLLAATRLLDNDHMDMDSSAHQETVDTRSGYLRITMDKYFL